MSTSNVKKEKIYVSKLAPSDKFGSSILKGSAVVKDLIELLQNPATAKFFYEYNGETRVNFQVIEWKNEDKFGRTHSLEIDTFIPDKTKSKAANDNSKAANDNEASTEDKKPKNSASPSSKKKTTTKRGSKKQAEPVTA